MPTLCSGFLNSLWSPHLVHHVIGPCSNFSLSICSNIIVLIYLVNSLDCLTSRRSASSDKNANSFRPIVNDLLATCSFFLPIFHPLVISSLSPLTMCPRFLF
ncbi:MAG: hypothetical protein [Circular genetic element sp.]|nr:MAG: hypothetical protein [Circular genetic element sp.]